MNDLFKKINEIPKYAPLLLITLESAKYELRKQSVSNTELCQLSILKKNQRRKSEEKEQN